jgi:hypothetical protein
MKACRDTKNNNPKEPLSLSKRAALWLARHDPSRVTLSHNAFGSVVLALAFLIGGLISSSAVSYARDPVEEIAVIRIQDVRARAMESLVAGYPIQAMIPAIAEENKLTAAFLVSIAKKESNWGKRVPRAADGSDCYNYWGYTGAGSRGVAMGHACFASPEEAIATVGGRLDRFIQDYELTTPEELIVWKCGFSCAGHSAYSVRKWIKDVSYYYEKII